MMIRVMVFLKQGCFSKALFALKQEDEKLSLLVKEAIKYGC